MRPRGMSRRYLSLFHLCVIHFACTSCNETPMFVGRGEASLDDHRISLRGKAEATSTLLMPITADYRESTESPIAIHALRPNASDTFKPSVPLGEIEQPRIQTSPFSNVQHVRLDSNVRTDVQRGNVENILRDAHEGSHILEEATRSSRIKFQDDSAIEAPVIHHRHRFDEQVVTESSRSQLDRATAKKVIVDQTYSRNDEEPGTPGISTIYGESTNGHGLADAEFDGPRYPYAIGHYNNKDATQPTSQGMTEITKRPDGPAVLVFQQQESTYTRKRKFPYEYYQPTGGYYNAEFAEEPRSTITYPRVTGMSTWKKIIHLIGTILPLGLLLATLTPNIVRIDNTTSQPNIVLSKLRVADLPAEHKRIRSLDDESAVCEDRLFCHWILAAGESRSNILQNILWNLAIRTSNDAARRSGLREIFSAVKKKNCTSVSC